MAEEVKVKKSLVLAFGEGMDDDGKLIIKRYTYTNVKAEAAPQDLFNAAQALAELYAGTVNEFETVDTNALTY